MEKNKSTRGMKYNGAIDRLNINENQIHEISGNSNGLLFTNDMFQPIPEAFYKADYVVCDPPWNNGNLKSFYIKADKELDKDFVQLLDRIFEIIKETKVNACYMEIGKQAVENVRQRMEAVFPHVRVVKSKYYNKYPCYFVFGEVEPIALNVEDLDELLVIENIIAAKEGCVMDVCNGRGAVSRSAYKHGKDFVCSELNINRLAVALEDLIKLGATVKTKEK